MNEKPIKTEVESFIEELKGIGKRFGKIQIELDGKYENITDLDKTEYEFFLKMMSYLKLLYLDEIGKEEL